MIIIKYNYGTHVNGANKLIQRSTAQRYRIVGNTAGGNIYSCVKNAVNLCCLCGTEQGTISGHYIFIPLSGFLHALIPPVRDVIQNFIVDFFILSLEFIACSTCFPHSPPS